LLSGNLNSSGVSQVVNNHGGTSPDDHNFPNRAFDFTGTAHTINVSSGILTFTSRSAIFPLDVTSTNPGGTTLTKTGPGVWLYEHAAQSSFTGTNRIEEGTLRLGASERLANASQLEVAGGTFDLRGFTERVATVVLESGEITGTAGAMLSGTLFEVLDGVIDVRLSGTARLAKSTAGTVVLNGMNGYTQATTISGGALLVNGNHSGGATYLVHQAGTLGGSGSIDAPVSVEGTLAPGASVGTFTVNNAVTFDVGAHFAVELSGATADKLVAVDLNLDADEFLDVSVLSDLIGSSWVVAEYTGALSGQFDQVTPGFRADYSTPGQIVLKVAVSGDYNSNGVVDAADYTVWRDALGSNVAPGSGADGTGPSGTPDGMVDQLDYQFWKDHFGDSGSGSGALAGTFAVPEPATTSLAGLMAGYLVIAGRNFTIQNLN
jgi:autotransporter-associated beta strand protein